MSTGELGSSLPRMWLPGMLARSRGMRFENVSVLIDGIKDMIRDMRYCW